MNNIFFPNQRGRPKNKNNIIITPELLKKHKLNLTKEIVDLFVSKKLITKDDKMLCMYLKKIYNTLYGSTNVASSCVDIENNYFANYNKNNISQLNKNYDFKKDEKKLQKYSKIYKEVINALSIQKVKDIMLDFCVFNKISKSTLIAVLRVKNKNNPRDLLEIKLIKLGIKILKSILLYKQNK